MYIKFMYSYPSILKPDYITNIGLLALPVPAECGMPSAPVRFLRNVWVEIKDGKVFANGPEGELSPVSETSADKVLFSADGGLVTPGFVDAHTHPVFLNGRQNEFVRRSLGESYQQISASGGGIRSSIRGVRESSEEQLVQLVQSRFDKFLAMGTTTIEAKSGYGLTLEDELKALRVIKRCSEVHPLGVSPTLLGAHIVPPEYIGDRQAYVDLVCNEMIPKTAELGLAESVDLFMEDGAFNRDEARQIFIAAKRSRLNVRIHCDQFKPDSGTALAIEFGALSADHLDFITDEGIIALAEGGVTAVLLPGAVFFLGKTVYAPARKMIENGCRIAIATDFNPGTSPTVSMSLMFTLGCIYLHLTPSELLWAGTLGGATAIKRHDIIGTLLPGYSADLAIWEEADLENLAYYYGVCSPKAVFKNGQLVAQQYTRFNR